MLIFAGLGASAKNVSWEGSFLSSAHSELCKGAVQAGMVCKYCCTLAGVLTVKNTPLYFFTCRVDGRVSKMYPKVPQIPVEALVHLVPLCQAQGSKTTLLIQVRAFLKLS